MEEMWPGCKLTAGSRSRDEHSTRKSQSCERAMLTGDLTYSWRTADADSSSGAPQSRIGPTLYDQTQQSRHWSQRALRTIQRTLLTNSAHCRQCCHVTTEPLKLHHMSLLSDHRLLVLTRHCRKTELEQKMFQFSFNFIADVNTALVWRTCAIKNKTKQHRQALLEAKYCPRVAAASCTQKMTLIFNLWPKNSIGHSRRLSKYVCVQNFIKLSAAVHELLTGHCISNNSIDFYRKHLWNWSSNRQAENGVINYDFPTFDKNNLVNSGPLTKKWFWPLTYNL